MRIKELGDLTGATLRAIRYYHQLGLLPVPAVRHGHRDYDLLHVARLTRIRWLTQAGVPLSRIADVLQTLSESAPGSIDADRHSILTDLNATVGSLDEQIARLQAQRDHVHRLVASMKHDHLSPMPPVVLRFYDDIERRADSERVRRVVRRERDFIELAFYRGDMPPEAALLYEGFSELKLAESLALFDQVADRSDPGSAPTAEEIEQVAAAVVERITRQLGPDLPRVARAINLDIARRAADLYIQLANDQDRVLGRAIADAVLTAIEQARA